MSTHKELAGRLRERMKLRYAGDCKCGNCQLIPADLVAEAADLLDSLSPPDGVGLTRWEFWTTAGGDLDFGVQEDGDWVRYEDANAALAAEKERADTARAQYDALLKTYAESRKQHTAAEARYDTLAGALRRISQYSNHPMPIEVRMIADAALATIPAKPETKP